MRKLTLADIKDLREYERERDDVPVRDHHHEEAARVSRWATS